MTSRQILSLLLSIFAFHHHIHPIGYAGLSIVVSAMSVRIAQDCSKQRGGGGGAAAAEGSASRRSSPGSSTRTGLLERVKEHQDEDRKESHAALLPKVGGSPAIATHSSSSAIEMQRSAGR